MDEWEGDVLGRRKYAEFLTKFLSSKDKPFVLNINARWGAGKTFFIDKWHEDLKEKYLVSKFNAWKNDYAEDPLIAVMSNILKDIRLLEKREPITSTENYINKIDKLLRCMAPIVAKGIIRKYVGNDGLEELHEITSDEENFLENFSGKAVEKIIEEYEKNDKSIDDFKKQLTLVVNKIANDTNLSKPMFIFIDELDRCRPIFAIETLEKIKHLFDIPEIIFIIATDTSQLSHSVKSIYGEGFNGRLYLKRFFDQEYSLPDPEYIKYAHMLTKQYNFDNKNIFKYHINIENQHFPHQDIDNADDDTIILSNFDNLKQASETEIEFIVLFTLFSDHFKLDLRSQNQCFNKIIAIIETANLGECIHIAYIMFLTMLEFCHQETFFKLFDTNMTSVRFELIKNIGYSSLNARCYSRNLKAIDFIETYLNLAFIEKSNLRKLLNNGSEGELQSSIIVSLFNNYDYIVKYKEKILIAGALS